MNSPDTIKILILWTVTPSLVEAFHAAFYSFPPPLGGHHLVGSFILSTALDGSTALDDLAEAFYLVRLMESGEYISPDF